MTRHMLHVALLFAGFIPVVWALCVIERDPRRAAVLVGLAAVGVVLNALALSRPRFGIRVPLRVIACGVALIVWAGVVRMWHWVRTEYLPGLPETDEQLQQAGRLIATNLIWIAVTVGYVIVTLLVLPRPPAPKPPPGVKPDGKIDFRTYGR